MAPTTVGPRGQAYAMQIGSRCFVLDNNQKFWQYDPAARSYTAKASPPTLPNFAGSAFQAVKLFTFSSTDKGYLGGQSIFAIPGSTTGAFPVFLYAYDPATNTWTSETPKPGNGLPYPDDQLSFFVNGRGFVCTFVNQIINNSLSNTHRVYCYEYDPSNSQWITRFDTPVPLPSGLTYGKSSQVAVINGKAYWITNAYPASKIGKSLNSEDRFVCVYEFDSQTNQLTLKLATNQLANGTYVSFLRLGLLSANKLWLMNEGGFTGNTPVASQLFWYDPATNQLNRTAASILIGPDKSLYSPIGFATANRLYIGLGEYSFVNGTPAGSENGFAEFEVN
ncbi:hypothetical protein [uncultured Spirosoma sp.]|uniref:hypothetical protein n=1 Tax=uncultured Spirosoma sp. TaxID=278208 RepID=UPI0025873940|nr:hypothetical protein [uncultured Spirosoma sp.]